MTPKTLPKTTPPIKDQMEQSPLHRALLFSNNLQALPDPMVAAALIFDALIAGFFWQGRGIAPAGVVALGVLTAGGINWELLRRLPTVGRSFGPDKPAALALGAVFAVAAALIGVIGLPPLVALTLLVAITGIAVYATWVEPFRLGVTHQTLTTKSWGVAKPLRLLHIADLHVERISPRERKLNALINQLDPDVIVFSGDFVNLSYTNDPQAFKDIRQIIGAWRAPLGVYCVSGTPMVEPLERVSEFVRGLDNLKLLVNRWEHIEAAGGAINLLGMITTHNMTTDRDTLRQMVTNAPEGGLALLLTHSPDIAPEAAKAGFELFLCGHTHGGQIRLPIFGALLSSSHLGKQYIMGRYKIDDMTLYTSRGIGMEGLGAPRARLFCPPEITLWEIKRG